MNHNVRSKHRQIVKSQSGYTIMEAIIAIAVCGSGLVMILGLYGMAVKTEMVSNTIFEQSLEINSIADDINLSLKEESVKSLPESVDRILKSKYPDYALTEVRQDSQTSLYELKILHKGGNSMDKLFHIKIFWSSDE
ncbi:hypothetical protein [Acetobacterium sp.]|uniref:type IV pilus modification PilV family protein n=1 Tax=Acetobacterium sp. TaxID=1872094 RepID=UPI003593F241